jgi:hypothetical protein
VPILAELQQAAAAALPQVNCSLADVMSIRAMICCALILVMDGYPMMGSTSTTVTGRTTAPYVAFYPQHSPHAGTDAASYHVGKCTL